MSKGKLSILMMAASLSLSCPQARGQEGMDQFIDELMAKMTVEEKIGQLHLMAAGDITTGNAVSSPLGEDIAGGRLGGVFNVKGVEKIRALQDIAVRRSRLGIPLIVGMDVIHGYETVFPIPLALAASWDMEAIERSARVAARECSADGICWTFSPMVDVAVDQRWGRVAEGSGEDPFLGSRVAEAMVRGYQGQEPYAGNDRVMACVKHFALYGASEGGKEYNTVDMSRLRMYNQYFPPYKAAVEAGAGSVMSSFNLVEGIHATANRWLLTDVLRGEWGFRGFVVTDYGSIGEFPAHGLGDLSQASVQSLQAGTDMDMCSRGFLTTLAQSLEEGRVSIGDIDRACRRVLEAKYKLGLFQDPYKYLDPKRREKDILSPENRETARRVAAETFVLLRNEGRLLPLQRKGKIALIGPLANTRDNLTGTWSVAQVPDKYLTLREAMQEAIEGKAELLYAQGSNICYDEAIQMVTSLARLFRIALSRGRSFIPLADELEHARHYMTIQQIRYQDRFTASVRAEEGTEGLYTLKLIVQPLLENAIYHGMAGCEEDGRITVTAKREGGDLVIDVSDNGVGMPPEVVERLLDESQPQTRSSGSGIGVRNVHRRIRLTFGEGYGLEVFSEPDEGTTVRIRLPALTAEEAAQLQREEEP